MAEAAAAPGTARDNILAYIEQILADYANTAEEKDLARESGFGRAFCDIVLHPLYHNGTVAFLNASGKARLKKLLELVSGIKAVYAPYDKRTEVLWTDYAHAIQGKAVSTYGEALNQTEMTGMIQRTNAILTAPVKGAPEPPPPPPKQQVPGLGDAGGMAGAGDGGDVPQTEEALEGTGMSDAQAIAKYAMTTFASGAPPVGAPGNAPEPHTQFLATLRRLERESLGVAGFGQNYLLDEDIELGWSQALAAVLADTEGVDEHTERDITRAWNEARRMRASDLSGGDAIYLAIQKLRDYYVMHTSTDYDMKMMRIWAALNLMGVSRAASMGLYEFTRDEYAKAQALRAFNALRPGGLDQDPQLEKRVVAAMKVHKVEGKYGPRSYGAAATILTT